MNSPVIFNFQSDISKIEPTGKLNNPFGIEVPEIARIAAIEFQKFIEVESRQWEYDFSVQKGKMFGVLVVQSPNNKYHYLGAISGKLPGKVPCHHLIPSVFDGTTDNFFFNRGMTALTEMGIQINNSQSLAEIISLKEARRNKSIALQQRLFKNYNFLNISGKEKNLLDIFKDTSQGVPPSAAGECAAPKLLQYAIKHQLKPVALTEFWWGIPNKERKSNTFYPACKNKCKPILEYMLENDTLYSDALQVKIMEPEYC